MERKSQFKFTGPGFTSVRYTSRTITDSFRAFRALTGYQQLGREAEPNNMHLFFERHRTTLLPFPRLGAHGLGPVESCRVL